jgi:hypothetical protein
METRRLGRKQVRSEHLFAGGLWLNHRLDNVPWSSLNKGSTRYLYHKRPPSYDRCQEMSVNAHCLVNHSTGNK